MTVSLLVFARTPVLGRAKTRLVEALGAERTHALYRAFLADTLATPRSASGIEAVLWAHTGDPLDEDRSQADHAFAQRGAGFGDRLDAAIADARERVGGGGLLVVGADTPHLPPAALGDAAALLGEAPAVLGPGTRGGFYLVGFAARAPQLAPAFRGAGESLAVARLLKQAGAPPRLLGPFFDVDEPADLAQLVDHLKLADECGAWAPPATFRAVRDLGLLEFA